MKKANNQETGKNEATATSRPGFFVWALIIAMVFASAASAAYVLFKKEFDTLGFLYNREINYGDEYVLDYGEVCYGTILKCEAPIVESEGEVDTKQLGQYEINFVFKNDDESIELKQTVDVVDRELPVITTEKESAKICPSGKIADFGLKVTDNFDGDLTTQAILDYSSDTGKIDINVTDSNGNQAAYALPATMGDDEAPVITMYGDEHITIYQNIYYSDAGAAVSDNCDEVELKTEGSVNANAVGTYEITYSAVDNSGNQAVAKRTVEVKKPQQASGTIYLTFDDGPSVHTPRLLDVLKKYNVKATFFVTGSGDDSTILREYQEGHTVALHTFTHDYAFVYQSEANYFDDLTRIQNRVKNITGVAPTLIRFPGGSSNTISSKYDGGQRIMSKLVKSVAERGFTYFDWNISSGDAGGATTSDAVFNNVTRSLRNGSMVVLQHDTKGFSVDAVERIIQYALNRGYTFAPLTASSFAAHHGINN